MVRRKELTEAWVSGIGAHVARIEVIGCVEYSQRQSHAILLSYLKLFSYFGVKGEEFRKTCPIRISDANEILFGVAN